MTDGPDAAGQLPASDDHSTLMRAAEAAAALQHRGNTGANWFFWVAGLSLVNTAIAHGGGDLHFVVGLAVTAIVDAIATLIGKDHPEVATLAMVAALVFSLIVTVIVVLFGWMSRKRWLWAFGIGMGLYLLDGVLYALLQDWMSAGFHAFALYSMALGFNAYRKLNAFERALRQAGEGDAFGNASASAAAI